jgi:hypothetical protein
MAEDDGRRAEHAIRAACLVDHGTLKGSTSTRYAETDSARRQAGLVGCLGLTAITWCALGNQAVTLGGCTCVTWLTAAGAGGDPGGRRSRLLYCSPTARR